MAARARNLLLRLFILRSRYHDSHSFEAVFLQLIQSVAKPLTQLTVIREMNPSATRTPRKQIVQLAAPDRATPSTSGMKFEESTLIRGILHHRRSNATCLF